MKISSTYGVLAALAILVGQAAGARITIPDLYSTGLAGEGEPDAFYRLAHPWAGEAYVVYDKWVEYLSWVSNDKHSRWISLKPEPPSVPSGEEYMFSTTFLLTNWMLPDTVRIRGKWSASSPEARILVNGIKTDYILPDGKPFAYLYDFMLIGGFQPGQNTLEFWVPNAYGFDYPVGLRVYIEEATVAAIPEPATFALLGLGLVALGLLRRRQGGAN